MIIADDTVAFDRELDQLKKHSFIIILLTEKKNYYKMYFFKRRAYGIKISCKLEKTSINVRPLLKHSYASALNFSLSLSLFSFQELHTYIARTTFNAFCLICQIFRDFLLPSILTCSLCPICKTLTCYLFTRLIYSPNFFTYLVSFNITSFIFIVFVISHIYFSLLLCIYLFAVRIIN